MLRQISFLVTLPSGNFRRSYINVHSSGRDELTKIQAFHTAAERDSKVQVRIGEEAKKETTAMRTLAVITMTFLPATFISVRVPNWRA